jgi:hypothetical protein
MPHRRTEGFSLTQLCNIKLCRGTAQVAPIMCFARRYTKQCFVAILCTA